MILKAWFIEEVDLGNGQIGQRQTVMEFDSETGEWIRPDARLADEAAIERWDDILETANKKMKYLINPVALMDFCNNKSIGRNHRKHGTGNDHSIKDDDPKEKTTVSKTRNSYTLLQ